MALAALPFPDRSRRTALIVVESNGATTLCPFFAKCGGLLVVDPDTGFRRFYPNTEHTTEAMCDLILKSGVQRLVLGFIGGPAAQKLRAAGIDIRLGSCASVVDELASDFDSLPPASA